MSYFEVKKQTILNEISKEMDSLLVNIEMLNGKLKDSVALGEQFRNISSLWNTFYKERVESGEVDGDNGDKDEDEESEGGQDMQKKDIDNIDKQNEGEDKQNEEDKEEDKQEQKQKEEGEKLRSDV